MKVYKFGGASVKDADGICNLAEIVSLDTSNLVIVVSAFGKTTNALERVLKLWIENDKKYLEVLAEIYSYHKDVINILFTSPNAGTDKLEISFSNLKEYLLNEKSREYDYVYDQVVSSGEIWSTLIVSEYLKASLGSVRWIDIRDHLITDDKFRDANILWNESTTRIQAVLNFKNEKIYVTQGFIGGTINGQTTTLGREGSDYTAAILGNIMDAEGVYVWKDVPGILNADPKWLSDAQQLKEISYKEAVEMTFSGAKVIHPKTIKPLHNKNIPLHVRSFIDPADYGTIIRGVVEQTENIPVFIKKEGQILISIYPKDFSFVMGDNLGLIFHSFMLHRIKVNLVQASAISLNICVDDERQRVEALINDLKIEYSTVYNEAVELLSVRHYTEEAIERVTKAREVLLEQRTRSTVRFVVRKN